jgi:anaerobic sulfite reductase subunit B
MVNRMKNEYIPRLSVIRQVIKHTELEYTFRMDFEGEVKPGQFFEISLPKYGEAPISVSGIGDGTVDFTIRRVGKVTNEIFENYAGDKLFIRGPYGNGFDLEEFKGKELVVIAGGTGLSPVRGVVDYFARHRDEAECVTLIAGFKSPKDVLFKDDFRFWNERIQVIQTVDTAPEGYDGPVGMVTKYIPGLKFADPGNAAFICVGPPVMIKFTVAEILKLGIPEERIWISHERKMCCGLGKCGHCKIGDTYICLDGPVFNYKTGKNLVD